ncbi:membrane protein involved in colicin uptake [Rheinheimera pacifica]|uniref:cell envelope integrity protein TolA n=1 Tax=Rheinheimera pacifica TaxID=173990 RepID=UPI002168DBA5|nr:cell envelope integrity protein TolA [Rheinheimera pacifica]MCS4309008.1 membrane protein involved in colicin uptake [Rheinheimera pacifica]
MIELVFSLLLAAPELEKKYEYCYKPNRCQMVNAVVYNTVLIRNQIQKFKPVLPAGLTCMVNLKLSPDGGITSISALNCDPQYSAMIIKGIVSASPFEMIPEAYSHVYDINLTISH